MRRSSAGELDDAREAEIRAAIELVRADLDSAASPTPTPAPPRPTPATTATTATATTAVRQQRQQGQQGQQGQGRRRGRRLNRGLRSFRGFSRRAGRAGRRSGGSAKSPERADPSVRERPVRTVESNCVVSRNATPHVPGCRSYYESNGPASAPALLLVPAGIATLRMWDEQVPDLASDHFVVTYDPRGFGGTTTTSRCHSRTIATPSRCSTTSASPRDRGRREPWRQDCARRRTRCSRPGGGGRDGRVGPERISRRAPHRRRAATVRRDRRDRPDGRRSPARSPRGGALGGRPAAVRAAARPRIRTTATNWTRRTPTHATDDGTMLPLEPPAFGRLGTSVRRHSSWSAITT